MMYEERSSFLSQSFYKIRKCVTTYKRSKTSIYCYNYCEINAQYPIMMIIDYIRIIIVICKCAITTVKLYITFILIIILCVIGYLSTYY